MKQGLSLQDLAKKLDDVQNASKDFIADTRQLELKPKGIQVPDEGDPQHTGFFLNLKNNGGPEIETNVNRHALNQIGSRLKIDRKYMNRLDGHPDLLAHNVNTLFQREPEPRMIRTVNGRTRAFLSNRYQRIDNYHVASVVLPILIEAKAEVISCEVTWKKLYIKAKHPTLERVIKEWPEGAVKGQGHNIRQTLRAAVVITNSEVGLGRVAFSPAIMTKECTNLAVWESYGYSKFHVGKAQASENEKIQELFSDKTMALMDGAVLSKIQDLAHASMDGTVFDKITDELKTARHDRIEADPIKTVELFASDQGLRQDEQNNILTHLLQGGDLTRYGLHAAVTRASSDSEDYDRATELESLGGKIIQMQANTWGQYAKAA